MLGDPFIIKKDTPLCPAGYYEAICIGVFDLGEHKTSFGVKHKGLLCFEIEETIKKPGKYFGKRFVLKVPFNVALGRKATIRKHIESWTGQRMTPQMIRNGINIFELYLCPARLVVQHDTPPGTDEIYANVEAIHPLKEGMTPLIPENDWLASPPRWILEEMVKGGTLDQSVVDNLCDQESETQSEQLSETQQSSNTQSNVAPQQTVSQTPSPPVATAPPVPSETPEQPINQTQVKTGNQSFRPGIPTMDEQGNSKIQPITPVKLFQQKQPEVQPTQEPVPEPSGNPSWLGEAGGK